MLLYQNILHLEKFLLKYKEFYIKTTISIKCGAKKIKVIKYQKLFLFYIILSFRAIVWS